MADLDLSGFDSAVAAHPTAQAPEKELDLSHFDNAVNPPGVLEAAARGAGQGLLLGTEPAVAGGLDAVKNAIMNGDMSIDDAISHYKKTRESEKAANDAAQAAHPVASFAGNMVGGLPLAALTGGAGELADAGYLAKAAAAAKGGAIFGGAQGLGTSLSNGDTAGQAAMNVAKGATLGGITGGVIGPTIGGAVNGVKSLINGSAAEGLKDFAERQAVAATGATGAQARKFAPGVGRTLLDKGIVSAGDSQANIADKAAEALQKSGKNIGDSVAELTANGAKGSRQDLIDGIQAKIDAIGNDPAQQDVKAKLASILEDVTAGPETPSLSQIEATKGGFQGKVNYDDPTAGAANQANADVASVYKDAGEQAAGLGQGANTEAAQTFADNKKLYGQLKPIADASEKRAFTQQQSPTGGVGDMLSYGVGGLPGVIAKKALLPRVNSTIAVGADKLANGLTAATNVGKQIATSDLAQGAKSLLNSQAPGAMKLASELLPALKQTGTARNATLFSLMQQPAYRELLKQHVRGLVPEDNSTPTE